MTYKIPNKSSEIAPLLHSFKHEAKSYYGNRLKELILFGSYARGNFTEESDIDLLLVLSPHAATDDTADDFGKIKYDFMLKHDVLISCHYTTKKKFADLAEPLYYNIQKEGVIL